MKSVKKFNTFFVNVAKDIGEENGPLAPEEHPSIQAIKANISSAESEFNLKPVDEAKVNVLASALQQRCLSALFDLRP